MRPMNPRHLMLRKTNLVLGLAMLAMSSAYAAPVELSGGEIKGSLDSTLTLGFGMRAQAPSCGLSGDPSARGCGAAANTAMWSAGDDGNLNYGRGDFFAAYMKGTHELLLKMPSTGLTFMGRFSYLLDGAADKTDRSELSAEAKRKAARDLRLLDLWVGKTADIGGQSVRMRLGNQVINWGESLFLAGGINATSAVDNLRLMIPGTQLKEAVLPAPMFSIAGDLASGLQAEAYVQFGWNRNRYAPIGTFFSASDIYDHGTRQAVNFSGNNFNVTGLDAISLARRQTPGGARVTQEQMAKFNQQLVNGDFIGDATHPGYGAAIAADVKPRHSGQFGLSMHYKPADLPMDIGAYYVRYHDKAPVLNLVKSGAAAGVDYQWQFLEKRELFGVSANFPLGNWAVGTELSYRPRDAVALGGCFTSGQPLDANVNFNPIPSGNCPMWADKKKFEWHVTGMLQLMPADHGALLNLLGADTAFVSLEGVLTRYQGVSAKGMTRTIEGVSVTQLPAAGYATWLDNSASPTAMPKGVGTANSVGFIADFNWTYDSTVIKGWQLTPGVTYFRGVRGDTPTFGANYLKGVQSANLYLLFNQNPIKWQAGMNYTMYFGGGERNFYRDRDFIGGFVSYNF